MSTINDTDLFIVERSGVSYKVPASELGDKLSENDLMVVERSGTTYKVTGSRVIEGNLRHLIIL